MTRRVGSPKGAKDKADRLFALIVRAHGSCQNPACNYVCTCIDAPARHHQGCKLQTAHIRSRRFNATRCDLRNALCLCAGCHHFYTDNPYRWKDLVDEVLGAGVYDGLMRDSLEVVKVDWPEVVEELKQVARERGVMS